LMSPLSAYISLTLLIISYVVRYIETFMGLERKSDQLRDMWIG